MERGPVQRPAVELIPMARMPHASAILVAEVLFGAAAAPAQIFTLTKDQMIELTSKNPFERFPDGRPKVPDALMERARGLSRRRCSRR